MMSTEELVMQLSLEDDFLEFEKVENPPSPRPDLSAFIRLDQLVPGKHDIVSAAEHDEIFLDIDLDALACVVTPDDVLFLRRCGVRLGDGDDGLAMFV